MVDRLVPRLPRDVHILRTRRESVNVSLTQKGDFVEVVKVGVWGGNVLLGHAGGPEPALGAPRKERLPAGGVREKALCWPCRRREAP